MADDSVTTGTLYINSDDRNFDHAGEGEPSDDDDLYGELALADDGAPPQDAATAAARALAARVLGSVRPRVRRERAALGRAAGAAPGEERLTLVTSGGARGDGAGASAAPPRAGYARSLHGGALAFAFERDDAAAAAGGAEADADGATDAPACGARLTFDADAVVGVAERETVVARGDWIRLMLEGDGLALVDASAARKPGARRTAVERGRAAYVHARVEEAALLDGSRLEVRATLARRCPAAATAASVQYVGATGPWREDLARVDAGAVITALVSEREAMVERVATLERALGELRAARETAALASASPGAAEPSAAAFGLPAVVLLSAAVAALGFAGGAYAGAKAALRRQYTLIASHSPI